MAAMGGCWRFSLRGAGCEVRGAGFEVRGAGCEVRGARCGVRGRCGSGQHQPLDLMQLFSVLSVDDRNKLQVPGIL